MPPPLGPAVLSSPPRPAAEPLLRASYGKGAREAAGDREWRTARADLESEAATQNTRSLSIGNGKGAVSRVELHAAGQQVESAGLPSFDDLLDIVNPLHHLPIVGTLYREWTGDEIASVPRILGGGLFGGLTGLATAAVNAAVEEATGSDIGAHALALFDGAEGGEDDAEETQFAALESAESPLEQGSLLPIGQEVPMASEQVPVAVIPAAATTMPTAPRTPSPAAANQPGAIPNLSPEAFAALARSFGDPSAFREHNGALSGDEAAP